MTRRGTAALIVVLVAVVAYVWLVEVRRRGATPVASAPEEAPLLAVPAARVARVELAEGETRRVAVRRAGGWTDESGQAWQGEAVADLLETLGTLAPVMVVDPEPEDPGDYGLGPEATHLRLVAGDGQTLLDLEVGERNPAWTGVYARLGQRREVVLVGAVLHWELEKLHAAAPEP
jgi:hypothetical protein